MRPTRLKTPEPIPADIKPRTSYSSQDEARIVLGANFPSLAAAADKIAAAVFATVDPTISSPIAETFESAAQASATVEAMIAAAKNAAAEAGVKPAELEGWNDAVDDYADTWREQSEAIVADMRDLIGARRQIAWEDLGDAVGGLRALKGGPVMRAWRAVVREQARKDNKVTKGRLDQIGSASFLAARGLVEALKELTERGVPLSKTALRDLMERGVVGTGAPTGRRTGRYQFADGTDRYDLRRLAKQRAAVAYRQGIGPGVPVFACPVKDDFIIESWPAMAGDVEEERPDVKVPRGASITGFWQISTANANLLADKGGVLLEVTGGYVTAAWRVLAVAGESSYRKRKMFVVKRLPKSEEKGWLGYIPQMRPTPQPVYIPAN